MNEIRISWDAPTQEKFLKVLEQIPDLIRGIAETRVTKRAEELVRSDNRTQITEKDMVNALFKETPSGFVPAMKEGLNEAGIDYKKYGHT